MYQIRISWEWNFEINKYWSLERKLTGWFHFPNRSFFKRLWDKPNRHSKNAIFNSRILWYFIFANSCLSSYIERNLEFIKLLWGQKLDHVLGSICSWGHLGSFRVKWNQMIWLRAVVFWAWIFILENFKISSKFHKICDFGIWRDRMGQNNFWISLKLIQKAP